jgi:hypothetical protein
MVLLFEAIYCGLTAIASSIPSKARERRRVQAAIDTVIARSVAAVGRLGGRPFVAPIRRVITKFGARAVSIAIVGAAIIALRGVDYRSALALLPSQPLFWLVLVCTYFVPIAADWVIYRRVWKLPPAGVVPLTRKLIGNELVLGYVGDAYLYAWACRRSLVPPRAIGQMKDVAILSATASSAATILFALAAAPFARTLGAQLPMWSMIAGAAVLVAPAAAALTLRNSIFALPRNDLLIILAVHGVRATVTPVLLALLWHLALPAVALRWWILFAAIRLVLSRLPFVSNKDVLLAAVAAMVFGHHTATATVLAMVATLITLCHVVAGVALSLSDAPIGSLNRRDQRPVVVTS